MKDEREERKKSKVVPALAGLLKSDVPHLLGRTPGKA